MIGLLLNEKPKELASGDGNENLGLLVNRELVKILF